MWVEFLNALRAYRERRVKIDVLDHGYVKLIEPWGKGEAGRAIDIGGPVVPMMVGGNDYEVAIIEAARQSTQGSFRGWDPAPCNCDLPDRMQKDVYAIHHRDACDSIKKPGDRKLLSFLFNNNHSTPFEFAGMTLEIEAPIMVFREWQRHRTQSYNESSARYAPIPNKHYVPTVDRIMMGAGGNKQAAAVDGAIPLTRETAEHWRSMRHLQQIYTLADEVYQAALESGIPKELARLVMPVGRYSKMRASANLRNWLAFMTLRCDPAAQWEIRQYANAVAEIIRLTFPNTFELWLNRNLRPFKVKDIRDLKPEDLRPGAIQMVEKPVDSEGGEL